MNSLNWMERCSHWLHGRAQWWLIAISLFFIYDIALDIGAGEIDYHLLVEIPIFVVCTIVLVAEWRRSSRLSGHLEVAQSHNQRLSGQFSDYVRSAFAAWNLSRSEQEVAWLILKGFSFPEIAAIRSVQEKTVRQQATSIYAKSGCANRNGLVAHFIQDLLTGEYSASEQGVIVQDATTSASDRAPE